MKRVVKRIVPERGREEFKKWRRGTCENCGVWQWTLRHHVVKEQTVRREGGDPWDLRNGMWVGVDCDCHRHHTDAFRRIPLVNVPLEALEFAFELLGSWAADYLLREYDGFDERLGWMEARYATSA